MLVDAPRAVLPISGIVSRSELGRPHDWLTGSRRPSTTYGPSPWPSRAVPTSAAGALDHLSEAGRSTS